jgi:uncharacterized protein with HEPN domain
MKSDLVYLDHILDSFTKVISYTKSVDYSAFLQNEEKQDAVIRKIEIAGEATKKLSSDLRKRYSVVPWRAIAGMRDKLIHDYFDVDLETVWLTVKQDIPKLIHTLKTIIKDLEGEEKS